MNILITGAAGFIGSKFAEDCWNKGYNIVLVDNLSYGNIGNLDFLGEKINDFFYEIDIRDKVKINDLIKEKKVDYIYNFAGIAPLPDCQSNPQEAVEINIGGFVNIIECARLNGVKNIIQASTNAVYENVNSFPTKEEDIVQPSLIYSMTKYSSEVFAKGYCEVYGMNIVCMRFANVYGPNMDYARKQPSMIAYIVKELYYGNIPELFSNGKQRRDYIFVDDVVEFAHKARNIKGYNAINLSSNENYSVNEVFQLLCQIMNCSTAIKYNDQKQYWGKYESLYDCKLPISDEVVIKEINKTTLCDNSKAFELCGWKPVVTIHEGLKIVAESICMELEKNEK